MQFVLHWNCKIKRKPPVNGINDFFFISFLKAWCDNQVIVLDKCTMTLLSLCLDKNSIGGYPLLIILIAFLGLLIDPMSSIFYIHVD